MLVLRFGLYDWDRPVAIITYQDLLVILINLLLSDFSSAIYSQNYSVLIATLNFVHETVL